MATSKNTIRSWFLTGLFPTQSQFWAVFDSFWHKDEFIPQSQIQNLDQSLDAKVDTQALNQVAFSGDYNDLANTPETTITLNGNPFALKKNPSNNIEDQQTTLQELDIALNGFWDGTEFWSAAIFLGGNKDNKSDWLPLSPIKEIGV